MAREMGHTLYGIVVVKHGVLAVIYEVSNPFSLLTTKLHYRLSLLSLLLFRCCFKYNNVNAMMQSLIVVYLIQ